MTTSRREFIHASALTAAAIAAGSGAASRAAAMARPQRPTTGKPLRILILGGTGFLGPACTESALARGHKVTLFNSGRSEEKRKEAGRPSLVPDGVEVFYGNRDPKLTADDRRLRGDPEAEKKKDPHSPMGLSQLQKAIEDGAEWDGVVDTSGYFPRMVKASAELLAPKAKRYIFISTLSVYKNNDAANKDESDTLATLADPATEEFGSQFENYGGGKALCEAAAEAAMPGRTASMRAGFIVGPRDTSGRFLYWPVRASKGGEMIVPGKPDDPIQIVDVRDLADFVMHAIETGATGPFNVTGPASTLTMQRMVEGCIKGAGASTTATWVDPEFLQQNGIEPGARFPLWIPPEGEAAGFHQRDISKALKAGLKFRPIEDTAKATLDWYATLPADIQGKIIPPLLGEKETELLAQWRKQQQGG